MKATMVIAVSAVFFAFSVANAQSPGTGDSSANTLCWDNLTNTAREKNSGAGKLDATGDYSGQTTGITSEDKKQGPGAEPKFGGSATSGVTESGRMTQGAGSRPAGIPNC